MLQISQFIASVWCHFEQITKRLKNHFSSKGNAWLLPWNSYIGHDSACKALSLHIEQTIAKKIDTNNHKGRMQLCSLSPLFIIQFKQEPERSSGASSSHQISGFTPLPMQIPNSNSNLNVFLLWNQHLQMIIIRNEQIKWKKLEIRLNQNNRHSIRFSFIYFQLIPLCWLSTSATHRISINNNGNLPHSGVEIFEKCLNKSKEMHMNLKKEKLNILNRPKIAESSPWILYSFVHKFQP